MRKRRVMLIVNPASGAGRCGSHYWPAIAARLRRADCDFDALLTRRPGEAASLTREALRDGAGTVVAVGGDGTANEVLNGFLHQDRPRVAGTRFGFIGAGTGNDMLRIHGDAAENAIAALGPAGVTRRIDVLRVRSTRPDGTAQEHYAFLHVALGLIAEAEGIALPQLIKRLGPQTYLWAGALAVLRHEAQRLVYRDGDGGCRAEYSHGGVVANLGYFGGGIAVAPPAVVDDGLADLISVRRVSRLRLLTQLMPALQAGTHMRHPAVTHQRVRELRIESMGSMGSMALALDGELVGRTPAEITVLPGALPLAAPPA